MLQWFYQAGSHFKHRPNKNGLVRFITDKVGSNLFQFMKLVIFKHVLLSTVPNFVSKMP